MSPRLPQLPSAAESSPEPARGAAPVSFFAAGALSWLGAWICLLLLAPDSAPFARFCPAQGGCDEILASRFAVFRGIPLPVFGVVFYLALSFLLLAAAADFAKKRGVWLQFASAMTIVAATFSAGLMILQFIVLRGFCPLCTASAVIVAGLVVAVRRAEHNAQAAKWNLSRGLLVALAAFAMLPAVFAAHLLATPRDRAEAAVAALDLSAAPTIGPREAPVLIVLFSDFECDFCRQLAPILAQVRARFPAEVRIAFRHFPLAGHARAIPAAVAAESAVEQGAFWPFHDRLFAERRELTGARLMDIAQALKLDLERFAQAQRSPDTLARVEASRQDALRVKVKGAPTMFLNGHRLEGAVTYEALVQRIEKLLAERRPPAR